MSMYKDVECECVFVCMVKCVCVRVCVFVYIPLYMASIKYVSITLLLRAHLISRWSSIGLHNFIIIMTFHEFEHSICTMYKFNTKTIKVVNVLS